MTDIGLIGFIFVICANLQPRWNTERVAPLSTNIRLKTVALCAGKQKYVSPYALAALPVESKNSARKTVKKRIKPKRDEPLGHGGSRGVENVAVILETFGDKSKAIAAIKPQRNTTEKVMGVFAI